MAQIKFAGSWHSSIGSAAITWAEAALPDTSVIGEDEDATKAATDLEAFWWQEAVRIAEGAPEGVDESIWRAACRKALVERIEASRS